MAWTEMLLLAGAGLVGGYVAGLVGVGGGIVFAPVLLFYFSAAGVPPEVVPSLTVGTSLFCTLLAALSSAWSQHRKQSVVWPLALSVGFSSALAIYLMTRFVTTQPWYTKSVFQVVFSLLLLFVVVRMVRKKDGKQATSKTTPPPRAPWPARVGIGTVAGIVSSAVGVGGGVVLVPAYNAALHLPIHLATGTSSATIVLISLIGVITFSVSGEATAVPATALGYVDFGHGLLLAVPSLFSARLGVWTAHRIPTRALRLCFAVLAFIVAVRLLIDSV